MVDQNYDIVIVGAGPAGCLAARSAARDGAKVLVLDKRREIGVPVQCGGALAGKVLGDLGIGLEEEYVLNEVDSLKAVSPSGNSVVLNSDDSDFILDREDFDKHLAVLAGREGADVKTWSYVDGVLKEDGKVFGVSYRGEEGEKEVFADVVIAADGVMSRVARWAGFDVSSGMGNSLSGVQFELVGADVDEDTIEFCFGEEIAPGGYGWIFPIGEGRVKVGVNVFSSKVSRDALKYLEDFVSSRSTLDEGQIVEINSAVVPVSGLLERTFDDNFLVVGDAARQGNALTGGGTGWALRAGDIAGRVSAEAVDKGDTSKEFLSKYQDLWEEEMGAELRGYHQGREILTDFGDEEYEKMIEVFEDFDLESISLDKLLAYLPEGKFW